VVSGGAGCTNCGAPAGPYYGGDCCGSGKGGLLGHLKGRFGKKSHDCGCAPAPSCCAPAPVPCNACDTCNAGSGRPNLLDALKSRWGGRKHRGSSCNTCGAPSCDPCAGGAPAAGPQPYPPGYYTPGAAVPPAAGGSTPPKEMPKPKDTTKPKEKGVSIPIAPSVLTGSSPY
jgi:hypothetical protein